MSVIHCWTAADFSPTERAGGHCTGVAASLVLDTWLQVARRPGADYDAATRIPRMTSSTFARSVAMFVFTGSAATAA